MESRFYTAIMSRFLGPIQAGFKHLSDFFLFKSSNLDNSRRCSGVQTDTIKFARLVIKQNEIYFLVSHNRFKSPKITKNPQNFNVFLLF